MKFTSSNALPNFPVTTKLKKKIAAIDSGFDKVCFYSQPHLGLRLLILDHNAENTGNNAFPYSTYLPESFSFFYSWEKERGAWKQGCFLLCLKFAICDQKRQLLLFFRFARVFHLK